MGDQLEIPYGLTPWGDEERVRDVEDLDDYEYQQALFER